jgi:hypothetical protein
MESYRDDEGGYRLSKYGDGLWLLTDSGHGQGRCLFFKVVRLKDVELLVTLLFYKKETQKVPERAVDTARRRMRMYEDENQCKTIWMRLKNRSAGRIPLLKLNGQNCRREKLLLGSGAIIT